MSEESQFAAGILRGSAGALSGFAAETMLDAHPRLAEVAGPDSFAVWKQWFADRIEDLIAALSAETSDTFVEQMKWAQSMQAARGLSPDDFRVTLVTLQAVLASKLPAKAQVTIESYLHAALDVCQPTGTGETDRLVPDSPARRLAANYLLALLDGDRQRATEMLLNAAAEGKTISELYQQVLTPALTEVGRMWMAGEISVAEEHFITATARDTMTRLRTRAECGSPNGRTVLAAAVAGNQHDVGLHMIVDLFELAGWRAINLGANVPIADLVRAVNDFSADVLLLSAALPVHLPTIRDSIRTLRAVHDQPVAVLVGGPAFHADPDLWSQLEADGCARTAEQAIALANQLLGISE